MTRHLVALAIICALAIGVGFIYHRSAVAEHEWLCANARALETHCD